jgi:hypothetical protein
MKKKYQLFQSLKDNSGFGWNNGVPTAPEDVWKGLQDAMSPTDWRIVKKFKTDPLIFYDNLHELFTGVVATGSFARVAGNSLQYFLN